MHNQITIHNARLHNLKNVSLSIPKNQLVVFTGLSGSGKSTLAFDTLHKEGQRQYMESLGMVSYAISKPAVDSITGLSPSISVDQNLTNHSPRSTVGTVTDVFTYLRVLFARLGHRPCPKCGADVPPSHDLTGDVSWDDESPEDGETVPCPACGEKLPEMSMASFSFNKPDGACPTCTGLGTVHEPILSRVIDESRSIKEEAVSSWEEFHINYYGNILKTAAKYYGFHFDPELPIREYEPAAYDFLLYGVDSPQFKRQYPDKQPPKTVTAGRFEGVLTNLLRRYNEHANDAAYREKMEKLLHLQVCPDCKGTRLKRESRLVTVNNQTIIDVTQISLASLADWLAALPTVTSSTEMIITEPILNDLNERMQHLLDVGVGYLTLDRSSPTLSAGEAQRLRLAALLGSGLTGVLYVLDEPTIGLHPRDTGRLINVLRQLRDQDNTVLVIEHDLDMLHAADFIVDVGPGAGRNGGRIVVAGNPETVAACPESITGGYLSGRLSFPSPRSRPANDRSLVIEGARAHNLKNITAHIPLGLLVAVTGPSGSGKSSLLFDILDRAARQRFNGASEEPGEHDGILGWEHIDRIVTIDQSAIGRSSRSNAATYADIFTPIREVFASSADARRLKLTPRHFSFNVPGGRCERCQGAGVLMVEMHFLPDVEVRCPVCHGRRFKREVLNVKYHGYDISQVLDMTIEEALPLFRDI
ncbi:MAG TPA: excinuclease ABC subunit UvrA, partial [Anaerolineales bacterium]|nr:excinuclease ABC subunit UvrA [Anaerolineales bacterium]